jgi:transcriptional regulator with GAF, ATPase, and Fis domain
MSDMSDSDFSDHLGGVEAAVEDGSSAAVVFDRLHGALSQVVGFKVLTVLKLDPATLRSVRLYSSEKSYPVGGVKQHVRSAWSEAVLDRHSPYVAHDLAALRATFPDSAAIEATGCGSIVAAPIINEGHVVGTMNLWHRDAYYDDAAARKTMPFAQAIAQVVGDAQPTKSR